LAAGGHLGVGNDPRYQKSHCFDKFPFPVLDEGSRARLAELGERLDGLRKQVLADHADLTMTGLYNVLERLREIDRTGTGALTAKERDIHDRGLVGVLKELHDAIDEATLDAYGWPHGLSEEEILSRLVDLNRERAEEEARGLIRWLRPDFQDPDYGKAKPAEEVQQEMAVGVAAEAPKAAPRALPPKLPERIAAVRDVLAELGGMAELRAIAAAFKGRRSAAVREALDALVTLGLAERAGTLYALADHRPQARAA
jgi:hypothetical protein